MSKHTSKMRCHSCGRYIPARKMARHLKTHGPALVDLNNPVSALRIMQQRGGRGGLAAGQRSGGG